MMEVHPIDAAVVYAGAALAGYAMDAELDRLARLLSRAGRCGPVRSPDVPAWRAREFRPGRGRNPKRRRR